LSARYAFRTLCISYGFFFVTTNSNLCIVRGSVQFLLACNIPFSLFIMVAIAVDRYLCICRPFTRVLTVHRAKLTVLMLALCASAVGFCVALMYGVHSQFPLSAFIAASSNRTLQSGYDVTLATGNDSESWKDATTSCADSNCSSNASAVELDLLNMGVCHPTDLLLGRKFQHRFQYFYYALFTLCLLTISILYALIYCSVLARRSRRHKEKTANLAAMTSTLRPATVFDVQQDNCEEMTMTALKVRADTEARKISSVANTAYRVDDERNNIEERQRSVVATAKLTLQERYRMANLKTAAMLFVVTAVFVITFLPASLIAPRCLPVGFH